jgi:hypothetical protein
LQGEVYRGPHYVSREAMFVEPASGAPLEFSKGSLGADYVLETTVHSKSLRTIPASVITVRLAFGPTTHGMIAFRMRADDRAPEPPIRITPDSPPAVLRFRIAAEDPYPGALALKPQARVVFTVERIDGDNGVPVFENPDATELLWEALGRPSPFEP